MKTFKFTIRGNEYEAEIKSFDDRLAKIEINGTLYNVELEKTPKTSKTPVLVRKPVVVPPGAGKIERKQDKLYKVKAPLPGSIVNVFAGEGDEVKKGDKLLVYEAMKMENIVTAEKSGTVLSVKVKPGDSVLQDSVLMEIEPES